MKESLLICVFQGLNSNQVSVLSVGMMSRQFQLKGPSIFTLFLFLLFFPHTLFFFVQVDYLYIYRHIHISKFFNLLNNDQRSNYYFSPQTPIILSSRQLLLKRFKIFLSNICNCCIKKMLNSIVNDLIILPRG